VFYCINGGTVELAPKWVLIKLIRNLDSFNRKNLYLGISREFFTRLVEKYYASIIIERGLTHISEHTLKI
jgi:hypothetical protein